MKAPPPNGLPANHAEGEMKSINSELWHACAGPLVSLPPAGSHVVYFPQGHIEQVAASMQKEMDGIPNCMSLPSKLICVLHNVTLHADTETDEVYAQMTLQPVNKYDRDALLASEMGLEQNKQPTEFFCKTLTASDTSTHGGFSVPRRAAEKIFPPLDFTLQPPAQELGAKDLHEITWTFRHIYRGQPRRHLLTTGWSVFVSTKRLFAGDSVLFIRDEKSQLLLGIKRTDRQQPALSSSVLSSDTMHIGILASASHAAANKSPFTIFYKPRASPSEFVIPLAKYNKTLYTQVFLGMRFRMMFETEECGVRWYMGTITGTSDFDPIRWKTSQWRNIQVQKRGSVGRSMDVSRYRGYDELRHDLACLFGIEGQLEDPLRTDWKLVYIDHENDILLVGDDPWEEFVSCVQSIKILSPLEVQQMNLAGDLPNVAVQNQAWRRNYEDGSTPNLRKSI